MDASSDWPPEGNPSTLVFGCGNRLFGDDGFGPAVIAHLVENHKIPDEVHVLDVGTSIREILFNLLLDEMRPSKMIIVDAIDKGRQPGEIFEVPIEEIPDIKSHDFSLHLIPSLNLLKELRDLAGMDVTVLACQVGNIPEEVSPGLSHEVKDAIPTMSKMVMKMIRSIEKQ